MRLSRHEGAERVIFVEIGLESGANFLYAQSSGNGMAMVRVCDGRISNSLVRRLALGLAVDLYGSYEALPVDVREWSSSGLADRQVEIFLKHYHNVAGYHNRLNLASLRKERDELWGRAKSA